MELCSSNIEKFLIFSYILGNGILSSNSKNKKIHAEKKALYFRQRNFLALRLKSFLYFPIFPEMKPCTFQPKFEKSAPRKCLILWENGTF